MSSVVSNKNVFKNVCLKKYNTWRVGGTAKLLYQPASIDELVNVIKVIPNDHDVNILGLGSNCLISDKGLDGHTILLHPGLKNIHFFNNCSVYAESGIPCAVLSRMCARRGLEGLEFLATIPGSLGGAITMNAGCFGSEMWDFVESVKVLDRDGNIKNKSHSDFDIRYRKIFGLDNSIIIGAVINLRKGIKEKSLDKIKYFLNKRRASQPNGINNCGSVFKNPHGAYAGHLIEACGLKGHSIGGAYVSNKHANFILSKDALSYDIYKLINLVKYEVYCKHNISLEMEVKMIGDFT